MKILGVIPSRYASSRFPGKPLVLIHGKSMIQRVYEQAQQAKMLFEVIVATDDDRIREHVEGFGGKVMMTNVNHPSGTDRCNEVMDKSKACDVVINIQGDEPFIHPQQINKLAECFLDPQTQIATLAKKITDQEEIFNPNRVKVVLDKSRKALYFSRSPIPYGKGKDREEWAQTQAYYRHIGIYAYRADILSEITQLQPSSLELSEGLEQLRWLENGYSIRVKETNMESPNVDTPEDLEKILKSLPEN